MAKSKDTSQKFNPKYIDDDGSTLDLTGVVNPRIGSAASLGHTRMRTRYRADLPLHYSVAEKPVNGQGRSTHFLRACR